MSEDGGGGGDKGGGGNDYSSGGNDYSYGSGGGGGDFFSNPFGSSDDYHAAPTYTASSTPAGDYSTTTPDFGDLSYLSGPADTGSSAASVGSVDSGSALSGGVGATDYGGTYGDSALPMGAMPASAPIPSGIPTPTASNPVAGYTSYGADNFITANAPVGPAGTGGADLLALARVNTDSGVSGSVDSPAYATSGAPGGISAGGTSPVFSSGGSSGGASDITAKSGGKDDNSWLRTIGGSNPLGTAIAGAGLINNVLSSRALAQSLQGPTGQSPQANLADMAAPLAQTGKTLTDQGAAIAQTGVDDLRTRATATDPNAATLINHGTNLTGYAGTGTLPPGMQLQVDQAAKDAKTARISFYASKNMPTDPTKNTSLRTDLERIDRDALTMASKMADDLAKTGTGIVSSGSSLNQVAGSQQLSAAQLGTNMVNSGITSSGLAGTTYNQLAGIDEKQTERTQKAIAAMAAALSSPSVKPAVPVAP